MLQIRVDDTTLVAEDIESIIAEDDNDNQVIDFVNAPWYRINLTDTGFDKYGTWEILADREELDGTSLEYILEVIQPT